MDTIDSIIERINRGEKFRMTVSGLEDEEFANWRIWFKELQRSIGGGIDCVNCNTMTSRNGKDRLEVDIGVIPDADRRRAADELRSRCRNNSPKIALR